MSEQTNESAQPVYRSRWAICDDCETVTIIENRDSATGVPDETEWEMFGSCMVCGSSLGGYWNADETPVDDAYWAKGKRYMASRVLAWIDDQIRALPEHRTSVAHGKAEVLTDLRNLLSMSASPAQANQEQQ